MLGWIDILLFAAERSCWSRGPGAAGSGPIASPTHSRGQADFWQGRGSDLKQLGTFQTLISNGDFHLLLGQRFQSDFRGPTFPKY